MVHSRQPQRPLAAHAVPAHQHVDLGVLQHVPDVNRAGDVRRRQCNRKTRLRRARDLRVSGIFRAEQVLVVPGFRPALFDFLRLVSFRYFLGHRSLHAKFQRNLNQ